MAWNLAMSNLVQQLIKPKVQMLLLLAALMLSGLVGATDWQPKMSVLATSLAAAVLAEWAFFGAMPATSMQSAAISGSIVGLLVAPGNSLLLAWTASVAAIASKKLLVFQEQKHIFNPAAFGGMVSVLIFGNQINWWGGSAPVLIVIGAGVILFRMNRLSLPFAYFAARALGAALFGGAGFTRAALLMPNLFFAFLMLVEPKTSPAKRSQQWGFGALCGIFAAIYYRYFPAYEGDMAALLTVNLFFPLLLLALPGRGNAARTTSENRAQQESRLSGQKG
jgi:Na+-translocating ferredoxin:NAD+ oxidoreductase RnfD subunit